MTEKVLSNKKNGMAMMILWIVLYIVALLMTILGAALIWPLFIIGVVWLCIGWIPFLGLKVLKPQEALVLTLFGKYVGTLKDAGFYYVNPFCQAVNPAAKTKLNQSGDVDDGSKKSIAQAQDIKDMAFFVIGTGVGGAISQRDDFVEQLMGEYNKIREKIGMDVIIPNLKCCTYRQDANLLGALANYIGRNK